MANTTLARPVVTMNLANRSIGRFGLLANRVMHPLVARDFGRQIAPLAVTSDLKIVPTESGIVAETSSGNINIDQSVYSRLLGKAGISQIDLPKGTDEEKIGDIFRAMTTRTPAQTERILENISVAVDIAGNDMQSTPLLFLSNYRVARLMHFALSKHPTKANRAFDKLNKIGLTPQQLNYLAYSNCHEIGERVVQHQNTSIDTLVKLATSSCYKWFVFEVSTDAHKELIKRGLTIERLASHAKHNFDYAKSIEPRDYATDTDMLIVLSLGTAAYTPLISRHYDYFSRSLAPERYASLAFDVLDGKGLTAEQLDTLSRSSFNVIRNKVAGHANSHVNILMTLASHDGYYATSAFMNLDSRGLSPDQLAALSDSKNTSVRTKVATHQNASADTLMRLSLDPDNYAVSAFMNLDSRGLSPDQLAALSDSKNTSVRTKVATHQNASADTLIKLSFLNRDYAAIVFDSIEKRNLNKEQIDTLVRMRRIKEVALSISNCRCDVPAIYQTIDSGHCVDPAYTTPDPPREECTKPESYSSKLLEGIAEQINLALPDEREYILRYLEAFNPLLSYSVKPRVNICGK